MTQRNDGEPNATPTRRRRSGGGWPLAIGTGTVALGLVGVIAFFPGGDVPVTAPTTTEVSTTTVATTIQPSTTDNSVPVTTVAPMVETTPVQVLANADGVLAFGADGSSRRIADWPVAVAYDDGAGGFVTQAPDGSIAQSPLRGTAQEIGVVGSLQQVIDGPDGSRLALVLVRTEIVDTEVFDGEVVAVDLATGTATTWFEGGDVVRFSADGDRELLTRAVEEFTTLELLDANRSVVWSYTAPDAAFLRHGVLRGDLVAVFRDSDVLVMNLVDGSERLIEVSDRLPVRLEWLDDTTLGAAYTSGGDPTVADDVFKVSVEGAVERLAEPGILSGADLAIDRLRIVRPPQAEASAGWRVVGVSEGDRLNVRSGPGPEFGIIGRLDHDDEQVELTGAGSSGLVGDAWWGVRLIDGVEGYVRADFLAPPASWTSDVAFACGEEPIDTERPVDVPLTGGSSASAVIASLHQDLDDCDRYIFVLGEFGTARVTPAEFVAVAGALSVTSIVGEAHIQYPIDVAFVDITAWGGVQGPALVMPTVAGVIGEPGPLRSSIYTRGGLVTGVSVFSNPARVIVDVVGALDEGGDWLAADRGGTVVVAAPIDRGADGIEIRGLGSWFEAAGRAELRDADGNPVQAAWTGPSLPSGPTFGSSVSIYAPYTPGWGEFSFLVSDVPAGNYRLFVGTECYDEAADDVEACGVEVAVAVP